MIDIYSQDSEDATGSSDYSDEEIENDATNESEDEDALEDDNEDINWGTKKKTYWEGDTADLEIGQDIEDANEEEAAALELHQSKLKRITAQDYEVDYSDDEEENASSQSKLLKGMKKNDKIVAAAGGVQSKKKLMGQLELMALGTSDSNQVIIGAMFAACV